MSSEVIKAQQIKVERNILFICLMAVIGFLSLLLLVLCVTFYWYSHSGQELKMSICVTILLFCFVLFFWINIFIHWQLQQQAIFRIGIGAPPPIPDTLSKDAHDFIQQCLRVNPNDRPTAAELLEHPFLRRQLSTSLGSESPMMRGTSIWVSYHFWVFCRGERIFCFLLF